jgi:hypothetical protein
VTGLGFSSVQLDDRLMARQDSLPILWDSTYYSGS